MRKAWRGAFPGGPGRRRAAVLAAVAAGLPIGAVSTARADEPLFGYVNTTDLLPKDKLQVEQWATWREGDAAGGWRRLEGRSEIDYGLTNNVQVTAYLDYSHLRADIADAPGRPERLQPLGRISRGRIDGVTGEAIWRVRSPYLDPVGVALLVDGTAGRGGQTLGLKAIGQKNFRDDTVVLAANLRVDVGLRETTPAAGGRPAGSRAVTPVEVSLGASYRFRPNWSLALELRGRNKYAGRLLSGGRREAAALYFGPTVHYGGQRWFFTLSALGRVRANHQAARSGQVVDSLVFAADRARWDGVRLRVGRTF